MKIISFFIATLIYSASAMACPDLSGTFSCPEWGDQEPQTLVVKMSPGSNGTTVYKYTYIKPTDTYSFRFRGKLNKKITQSDGAVVTCREDYLDYDYTANRINNDGDYQAERAGQVAIICPRQK